MANNRDANIAAGNKIIASSPELQAKIQETVKAWERGGYHPRNREAQILQRDLIKSLQASGVDTHDLKFDKKTGALEEKNWLNRNGALAAGLIMAPVAGAFALPALVGAGGTAAAGGGTAAATGGTTAAVAPAAAGGGGMLSSALPMIELGAGVAGSIANARAANRSAEAGYAQDQDTAEVRRQALMNQQIQTDLDQRKFASDDYQRSSHNAVLGDLLQGLQDVSIQSPSQVPRANITGGLRPSAMANRGTIGNTMYQRAIAELLDPLEASGITAEDGSVPNASTTQRRLPAIPYLPELRSIPQSNAVDTGLGMIDIAGAGIGVLNEMRQNRRRTAPAPTGSQPWRPNSSAVMNGVSFNR